MSQNQKWVIDPTHSEIQFKVKHLVISTVTGSFKTFEGEINSGDEFTNGKVTFSAQADSIFTNNEQRDGHLKSADFFDAEKFPVLSFESTSFTNLNKDHWKLEGNLTIKEVTKHISLEVEFGGKMVDPYGNHKAGFMVTGKINRKEFGLTWSAVTEAGGVVVSDEVKIECSVQVVKG
jgi:polyisoprenoid-binding protein YceI